ncbi:class D beta-lactamase [Taibaiella helva]|uniref:class D beta-lactamase n=1 Tax=Taibaiella helva TaxID=2301235 RepID=UPI000E57BAB3|nr:class D beta-lactamase [Taibaiella helva]
MKYLLRLSPLFLLFAASCTDVRIKEHPEWKSYFDAEKVDGCFELYDNNKEIAHYYNRERCAQRFSPASTFKIFNSLVGLETAVAPDEQLVIKWDGIKRWNEDWNKDLTMAQAFKVSALPYYQELARRIGREKMQHYLDTVKYGNMEIGDSVDAFWINHRLRISADEQVGFIKRLYHTELPFSERTQRIVRGMMLQKEAPNYKLYYKTGWNNSGGNLLWIVGYVEKSEELKNVETGKLEQIPHPYFFALNFSTSAADTARDLKAIRLQLLQQLLDANDIGH